MTKETISDARQAPPEQLGFRWIVFTATLGLTFWAFYRLKVNFMPPARHDLPLLAAIFATALCAGMWTVIAVAWLISSEFRELVERTRKDKCPFRDSTTGCWLAFFGTVFVLLVIVDICGITASPYFPVIFSLIAGTVTAAAFEAWTT